LLRTHSDAQQHRLSTGDCRDLGPEQGGDQALATAREAEVNEQGKIEGIDIDRVSAWMAERTPLTLPLAFKLIAGGRSNMTFTVTDAAGRRFVLRRPPLGKLLPSAHDMAREHRLMSALADTAVPVPRMLGLCQDSAVNERDFYVMHFLDGVVVRDIEVGRTLTPQARKLMCHSLIETLCTLHRVDVDAIGLGNLAKREGYVERQLKRWSGQWEQSRTRDLPLFDTVRDALAARMPPQSPATIAHGDYRLSNCMMDPAGPVVGVLDWELCTLGEPMADLGGLLGYWFDPSDPGQGGDPATTGLPGFLTQDEMAGLYADSMGVSLASVDYYRAFAQWRLASIGEGVYARYLGGQQGSQDEPIDLEAYKASIPRRVERAARLLGLKTSA
jgi:aminoglycoside phosphotransferase (APT) family kinase protein